MSGETEKDVSGWTTDTLRIHMQSQLNELQAAFERQLRNLNIKLDERYATQTKALDAAFIAADKAVVAALSAAEKAVGKAETAAEKRFDSVNEFRAQLSDQANTFMPRAEAEIRFTALGEALATTQARSDNSEGKDQGVALAGARSIAEQQRQGAIRTQLFMGIGLIISLLAVVVTVLIATR